MHTTNPRLIGVSMYKGFKFGSEVSCKQNKFEQKIHSKWKNVDVKFWTKGINICRRFSGMPMMLYCLLLTVFDLFWSFKNRVREFKYRWERNQTLTTCASLQIAWLHTLLSHVKTINAWSYYRYYRVLHYARVYFHLHIFDYKTLHIRGCDSFKLTVPWCCHDVCLALSHPSVTHVLVESGSASTMSTGLRLD